MIGLDPSAVTEPSCQRCGRFTDIVWSRRHDRWLCPECRGERSISPPSSNGRPSDPRPVHLDAPREPIAKPALPLRFVSAVELGRVTPQTPAWVWDGYLARGSLTMLAGKPKCGKSTLAWALVAALADGAPMFLGRGLDPGPVVIVSEEGAGTLAHKLPASERVRVLTRDAAWPRPSWSQVIAEAVSEAMRVAAVLLVIDALAFWADLAEGRENDAGATQQVMAALGAASHAELGVLLVHHQRKSGGEGGDAVRGTGAILAAVDALVELERFGEQAPAGRQLVGVARWPSIPARCWSSATLAARGTRSGRPPTATRSPSWRRRIVYCARFRARVPARPSPSLPSGSAWTLARSPDRCARSSERGASSAAAAASRAIRTAISGRG
jgi:hypothetical protein